MTEEQIALAGRLRGLHLPEPVGYWPLAPGWWLLTAILALLLLWFAVCFFHRRRLRSVSGSCAHQLGLAYHRWQHSGDTDAYMNDAPAILRRVAVRLEGRERVARLSGQAWVNWLDTASSASLAESTREWISLQLYQPARAEIDVTRVHRDLLRWARRLHA